MRIQPPNSGGRTGRRVPIRTLQERAARQAAIEKSLAGYLHLVCGHYSTLEADEGYSVWRPRKGVTVCETCHDWVEIAKPPAPALIPDEPLF